MRPAASSLAFRALLKSAAARAGLSRRPARLAGLSPAALALHAAVVAQDEPVLLVVPTDALVEDVTADARFFAGVLSGLSELDLAREVLPLPSQEVDPYRGLAPHLEVVSARARALYALASGTGKLVVASARSLVPTLASPDDLTATGLTISPGLEIAPADLAIRLAEAGFVREDPVDQHGEFCVRGGVVDLYPTSEAHPVRLEFVGDIVESVRRYDEVTQRSLGALDQIVVTPEREHGAGGERSATIRDYVRRAGAACVVFEPDDVDRQGRALEEQWRTSGRDMAARGRDVPAYESLAVPWDELAAWLTSARSISELEIGPRDEAEGGGTHVACRPALAFHGRLGDWVADLRQGRDAGDTSLFIAATPGRAERAVELLADYDIRSRRLEDADGPLNAAVLVTTGRLSRGFALPEAGLRLYAETDVFEEERRPHERQRSATRSFLSDFRDLKIGDLVVHVDSGIGRFVGLKRLAVSPLEGRGVGEQEFMELHYAGDDKLFVPLERLDLVQKYTGGAHPALDRLGGTTWEKAKTRVKKAVRDMAEELLALYAARKAVAGHAFSPNTHWQQEFDDAFEFELTVDQRSAIADITKDLETPTPMDRLLCGDVGYGKTEVAMRAAFKVVMEGKQVAFLAPTTVLAFQHLRTLQQRFAGFPVRIDLISRFRTPAEQKATVAAIASGAVDITVGTHRLLSKDVQFRDLGLVVVDEEQRFGVTHKERLKQIRRKVDVLTMTATPIPRTLNMSLVGIRDMSVIETPPRDRLAIQTNVVKFDQQVIARAIRAEIERGGQAYFVHNRVESIFSVATLVQRLVPEARIVVGHGQMSEAELERAMVDFVAHKFDVLVATTIVENGLDIPNANTIIINRADRYGLAQLYQLRGRVGRSDRHAYAYLLIPPEQALSPIARRRLAALREFSDLGSGFRIAALDLEIRGAGNLLGGEQSGHIEAVGFDTYTKLLEDAIREMKGEDLDQDRRAVVNLGLDLRVDDTYIPDMNQRLTAYRRVASARRVEEIAEVVADLADRYGAPPASVERLAAYARIRVMADRIGLESIEREGAVVVLKFRSDAKLDPAWLLSLVQKRHDLTLLPPASLRLDSRQPVAPVVPRAAPPTAASRPAPGRPASKTRPESARGADPAAESGSWWTSRAVGAEVTPGFSREAVLATAASDPAAKGGIMDRLGELLERLTEGLIAG